MEGPRGKIAVRRLRHVLLVAALFTAVSVVGASSASAVIVHVSAGRALSYQPLRGAHRFSATPFAGKNLIYHGGPVMTSNTNYTFYWAPSGSPAYAAGYQSGINTYLEDLAHDSGGNQNVDSVATQYTEEGGEAAELRLALRGRDRRHRPVPEKRLQSRPRSA